MTDQINATLVKMSQQMGELSGKINTHIESQKTTNKALFDLTKEHRLEIKSLNRVKNLVVGLGSIGIVGVTLKAIGKLLTVGGH